MAEPISSTNLTVNSLSCPRPGVLCRYFPRLSPPINSITRASWFSRKMQSMISTILSCFASLKWQNRIRLMKYCLNKAWVSCTAEKKSLDFKSKVAFLWGQFFCPAFVFPDSVNFEHEVTVAVPDPLLFASLVLDKSWAWHYNDNKKATSNN